MAVLVKEQVSEAVVRTLQIRCSLTFHRKTSALESLLNKVAGLKVCNSIKKKLQHRCLPGKFEISKKTFFDRTALVAASEVYLVFSKIGATVINKYWQ